MNKQIIINGSHNRNGDTTKLIQEIYPEIASLKLIDYTIEIYNYDETYSDKDQFLEIINQIIEFEEIIFFFHFFNRFYGFFDRRRKFYFIIFDF